MTSRVLLAALANSDGKAERVDIPSAVFPDMSPLALSDERHDPVLGSITVKEPPPPPGVKDVDGRVVETQITCLSKTILKRKEYKELTKSNSP